MSPEGSMLWHLRGSGGREHLWKQQHQVPLSVCLSCFRPQPEACSQELRRLTSQLKLQEPVQRAHAGDGIPGDQKAQVTDTLPGPWAVWRLQFPSLTVSQPGKHTGNMPPGGGSSELGESGSVWGDGCWLCCPRRNMARWAHCLLTLEIVRSSECP